MALADRASFPGSVNLDDSDETFFCPDLDKDPGEARDLDVSDDNDETYFERTYSRLERLSLVGTEETFFEKVKQAESLDGGTEETFYEPAERAMAARLPESDETFYEPAEQGRHAGQDSSFDSDKGFYELADQKRRREDEDSEEVGNGRGARVVAKCEEDRAEAGACSQFGLFSHDLEWSQCWETRDDVAANNDLYVQLQDPLTQEMRTYKVPGLQADPDTMRLLTQDFGWTEHLVAPRPPSPSASDLAMKAEPSDVYSQDLGWTQQALPSSDQAMDAGEAVVLHHEASAFMQDFGWAQVQQLTASSGDQSMHSAPQATASSVDQSMDVMQSFVKVRMPRPSDGSSSLESSEAQVVPSMPSFEDDALPVLPLWPEDEMDQIRIEEIVTSLSGINFKLDAEAIKVKVDPNFAPPPPPPPPSTLPAAQPTPSSPTFSTTSRRRGRPPRPRAPRTRTGASATSASDMKRSGLAPASPSQAPSCSKRKRPGGPGGPGAANRRSQSAFPTCSPSSPPRHKLRRHSTPGSTSQVKLDLSATYTRLQELRFLMQDILGGREPVPAAGDVTNMQQEVHIIVDNLRPAVQRRGSQTSKARLKREQAQQVADKLLHQLRVLSESQESYGGTEEPPQGQSQSALAHEATHMSCSEVLTNNKEERTSEFQSNPPHTMEISKVVKSKDQTSKIEKRSSVKSTKNSIIQGNCEVASDSVLAHGPCVNDHPTECFGEPSEASVEESKTLKEGDSDLVDRSTSPLYSRDLFFSENPLCNIVSEVTLNNAPGGNCKDFHDLVSSAAAITSTPKSISSHLLNEYCEVQSKTGSSELARGNEEQHPSMDAENQQFQDDSDSVSNEQDHSKQAEYQHLVNLIKLKASTKVQPKPAHSEPEDFIWRGGPLKLTGILLPRKSELEPIDDLPSNFWGNPQAPIPDDWVKLLDWDD